MMTLANGEKFSPQFIEGRLKFSPYIRDVMAVGPERDMVTALIVMDFGNVGNWAERRGLGYTTFIDLSQKPEVYDPGAAGGGGSECEFAGKRPCPPLRPHAQRIRRRRSRDDPLAQAAPQRALRQIRRHHRSHVRRHTKK
jgi:hypothetical protein